jgi:uncharacterized protein YdeI (YjbR/CyaY-like superfamily)
MMFNSKCDAYIEKSAEFAQPILTQLRNLVHSVCPEVEETIKWGMPTFMYKNAILCSMASFKNHCSFSFWLGGVMDDPDGILNQVGDSGMGQLGKITSMNDLPDFDILKKYIIDAMELTNQGIKIRKTEKEKVEIEVPISFLEALNQNDKAKSSFEQFSPSHRKEYIQWIAEAKTEATRDKRIATAIEWLSEGKSRNWKYAKC